MVSDLDLFDEGVAISHELVDRKFFDATVIVALIHQSHPNYEAAVMCGAMPAEGGWAVRVAPREVSPEAEVFPPNHVVLFICAGGLQRAISLRVPERRMELHS